MGSTILTERTDLQDAAGYLLKQHAFLFDVETYGPDRGNPSKAPVYWLSIASNGIGIVIPMGHPNGEMLTKATRKKNPLTKKFDMIPATFSAPPKQLNPGTVFEILEPLFMHPTIRKSAFNATFDNVAVAKYYDDTPPAPPYDDPIVQQWLLNENMISLGLKDLTTRYYQHTYDKEHVGRQVEIHPFSKVARYAYLDAKYPWLMQEKHFLPMIAAEGLRDIYDLEMQVLEVLLSMRMTGAMVDVDMLHTLRTELSAQVVDLEGAIYKAAGQKFNLNSAPQKQKILFGSKDEGGQGLKPIKETKGGAPSTDAATLESYPKNPVCASMLEYQEVNKILSTYVNGYLGVEGDPSKPCIIYDGRIHADLVQYGTVTGRFSCRSPNMQNIPRPGTPLGTKVRGLFRASPGHKLVVADYGQIELVVLAHYSRAKGLVDGFNNGVDAHTATAGKVYGVGIDDVTKSMRQTAKGLSFACVPMSTEALTRSGWKRYEDLHVGDYVLGFDGKLMHWTPVRKKVRYEEAPVVRMANAQWESFSTPNHRWDTVRRTGRGHTRREIREWATTESLTSEHKITLSAPLESDSVLPVTPDEAAIIAWLHTDGHIKRGTFTGGPSQAGGRRVKFHGSIMQSKPHYIEVLDALLESVPNRRYEYPVNDKHNYNYPTKVTWHLGADFLRDLWIRAQLDTISLEQFVLRLSSEAVQRFTDACWQAEGTTSPGGAKTMRQNEGPVLEAMHTAAYLCGYDVTRTSVSHAGNKPNWTLLLRRPHITMQKVEKEHISTEPVWCIVTDEQNWVMRQGNRIMLTGNTVYGAGPDKVALMSDITLKEAKNFLAIHEQEFPEIYRFKDQVIAAAKTRRPAHIRTLMGRKRRLPALFAREGTARGLAERQAVNSLIQGSSADIIKLAMIRLHKALPQDCKLILSVHDELVVECPEHKAEEVEAIMREAMLGEGISKWLSVPMTIDLTICDSWDQAK